MLNGDALYQILSAAPVFLLIAVRALAMIETAPMLSSDSIPQTAKIALAGFAAFAVFPTAGSEWAALPGLTNVRGIIDAVPNLNFLLLLVGEALIGITTGFFMTIIFAAFSTAGQFFSLQMGWSASETFDPLAQVENPLLGQFLNLAGMLTFLVIGGFRELFLGGFWRSIQSLSVVELAAGHERLVLLLLSGLTRLFFNAMMISLPILGSLFLTTLATGLISKAAPQINMMSEGFPISTTVAFILIITTLPFMVEGFSRAIYEGFQTLQELYITIGGGIDV
ncbi:MAG: flagellar biosynthetic protein FliR [Spirochaetaceae bacterium]|jgi:flagellar biosynthetic protein FliR|nr:flagellar biosynthetic protein FliR [Spirochaetaceae bacterium]